MSWNEHLEGEGCRDDQNGYDRSPQHWQGDKPELLPGRSAVNNGGLIKLLINTLEACQEDNHIKTKVLPKHHANYRSQGIIGILQKYKRRKTE